MTDVSSKRCLQGRPFGGVAVFVKDKYASNVKLVKSAAGCIILQLDQTILINVYYPCSSVSGCDSELVDCLSCIVNDVMDTQYSNIVFGGDINIDFSNTPTRHLSRIL